MYLHDVLIRSNGSQALSGEPRPHLAPKAAPPAFLSVFSPTDGLHRQGHEVHLAGHSYCNSFLTSLICTLIDNLYGGGYVYGNQMTQGLLQALRHVTRWRGCENVNDSHSQSFHINGWRTTVAQATACGSPRGGRGRGSVERRRCRRGHG